MARRIVVFSDGTGNSAASTTKTNVWRLYEALDLTRPDQLASFDDGVGTSSFKPIRMLGLALGFGVKRNVLDLYLFLCRNWRPGDEIFAFGFSRGAFTIRVLCGLIAEEGLLPDGSDEELRRGAVAAYRRYRARAFPATAVAGAARAVRDTVLGWRDRAFRWQAAAARRDVPIAFVGLWDTVAAYGLPIDELTQAVDRWIWPMKFENQRLRGNVLVARHALSLDDPRRTFFPIPWEESEPDTPHGESADCRRLLQVWFAGAHANVGGGYADDRLSHEPLCWMIDEAARFGLAFKPGTVAQYRDVASFTGRLYDPRAGVGAFYRYQPRSLARLTTIAGRPAPQALVHASAIRRMAEGVDHYAPVAIDRDIDVLDTGNVVTKFARPAGPPASALEVAIDGLIGPTSHAERAACTERALDLVWWRRLFYFVMLGLAGALAGLPLYAESIRIAALEAPNALAADLLSLPLRAMAALLPGGGWWAAAAADQAVAALLLAGLFGLAWWFSALLRVRIGDWGAAGWSAERRAHAYRIDAERKLAQRRGWPVVGGVLAAAGVAGLLAGLGLALGGLSPGWSRGLVALGAAASALGLAVLAAAAALRRAMPMRPVTAMQDWLMLKLARRLRNSATAVRAYRWVAATAAPALLLAAVGALLVWPLAARAVFDLRAALGGVCAERPRGGLAQLDGAAAHSATFRLDDPCWASGAWVERGQRYRVELASPAKQGWFDRSLYADMGGVANEAAVQSLLTLAKRWWAQPYFQPIARIGAAGRTEFPLEPAEPLGAPPVLLPEQRQWVAARLDAYWRTRDPAEIDAATAIVARAGPRRTRLVTEFTAAKSGELFLYVNDAVPMWWRGFYGNNLGEARVTISRME